MAASISVRRRWLSHSIPFSIPNSPWPKREGARTREKNKNPLEGEGEGEGEEGGKVSLANEPQL